ncbi:MAG: ATP-dependent DNA helicase RecG [Planctomycetota bacterium]|jgi:ATP-dependent DNA helicase RecG
MTERPASPSADSDRLSQDDPLQTPAQFVKNVGPDRAVLLEKLGLRTARDILFYMPRDVLDLSDVRKPSDIEAGLQQSVIGTVVDSESRRISGGRTLTAILLRSGREFVRGVWFNQPWMLKKLRLDDVVMFSGKPKRSQGRWDFSNPMVQWLDADAADEEPASVLPNYSLTDGLKMQAMRRITKAAVEDFIEFVPEMLPEDLLEEWKLPSIKDALTALHTPRDMVEFEAGQRRLLFEDLVEFQLAVALRRRAWKQAAAAPVLKATAKIDSRIRRLFPFRFTAGQDRAVQDISRDLASGEAMHRLLQADVGAGKTAIALYAMLVTVANDHQAVLMAPTELLASQHWQTIDRALAHSRVKRALLTGQLTAAQRRKTLEQIQTGDVQLVIGTQALIQQGVDFAKLGLAVIDEQHKFGVGQRAKFSDGDGNPHVLVMTATPIPRSLCLTQFGDLDLTVVSELPPGRQPVKTWRVGDPNARGRAWKFIRERLQEGRQVYVVCPRVGEADESTDRQTTETDLSAADKAMLSETEELTGSTEQLFRELQDGELKGFRLGMVHGRMDAQLKTDTMDAFREGEIQALISTTVIEVSVCRNCTSYAVALAVADIRATASCSPTRPIRPSSNACRQWSSMRTDSRSPKSTSNSAAPATSSAPASTEPSRSNTPT